jgi:lipid II:glycine glycyltransferase (peptidoglycan interpeptide bridge formation enzyme)
VTALVERGTSSSPAAQWDSSLAALNGHLLQSWQWGEFKSKHGWDVERVGDASAMVQVLFRRRGPFSLGYIPRGPAFDPHKPERLEQLFAEIDEICRSRRAIHLIVETDSALPFKGTYRERGFVRGPEHFQPARTVKVPLLDDDALLSQMHQKTRYSVRLAYRRGVEIRRVEASEESIDVFYRLLSETSDRNDFGIHSRAYYRDFAQVFGERALMLIAYVNDEPAAALISARFGSEAIYMYGASSTTHRAHGAAFALQFEAMRWAREHGCKTYDLWGIPNSDPQTAHADGTRVAGTKGDDWSGLYKFKVGFGGEIVSYPPTLERRYHPFISFAVRRAYANRHV